MQLDYTDDAEIAACGVILFVVMFASVLLLSNE